MAIVSIRFSRSDASSRTCARWVSGALVAGLALTLGCEEDGDLAGPTEHGQEMDPSAQGPDHESPESDHLGEDASKDDHDVDEGSGATHDPLDHCRNGYPPDPRDDELTGEPLVVDVPGGGRDLLVPQLVLDWMEEHAWEPSHDDWHNIRRWDSGCKMSNAPAEGCAAAQRLLAQGLWRAPIQERAPGDGYAFLVMHRHMIHALKQAFPKHADLFSGFTRVPRTQDDPENPTPWREISWTSGQLAALDLLDNIEDHLDRFASEDELGLFMESAVRWTPENYAVDTGDKLAGIHPALHFQWAVAGSPGDLGKQAVNNRNFIFYKFHGWSDDVRESYRRAKGIGEDDPTYVQEMFNQCKEMHDLDPRNRTYPAPGEVDPPAPSGPPEVGFAGFRVRPILERNCSSCHGAAAPQAGLTLGGEGVATADVVAGLVGVRASNGEYDLVVPGEPDQSWLYLKISGDAAGAVCSADCNRQRMPAGEPLTDDEIVVVRQWILQGAPAPQ